MTEEALVPTTLRGLKCTIAELPDYPFDGHEEDQNLVLQLRCPCASEGFDVESHTDEDGEPMPPVRIICDTCGRAQIVFDPLGASEAPGAWRELSTDEVEGPYELHARFGYDPTVVIQSTTGIDDYSWFTLVGLDVVEHQLGTLLDYECQ